MIIYDLRCSQMHRFEGWFSSADDYLTQKEKGLLICPVCDCPDVLKVPSATHLITSRSAAPPAETTPTAEVGELMTLAVGKLAEQVQDFLDKHSEYVGNQFTDEVRRMHDGESDERNVHGEANAEQVAELLDEGIDVFKLPLKIVDKKKLN